MIIVKAPLRVSFLGGGTDYFDFFKHERGSILGTSIDKYVYVFANSLPAGADQHIRFTYREVESVSSYLELQHPVLRAAIPYTGFLSPLNISTMSDIPGSSGLGSSSAFSVATLLALSKLGGSDPSPEMLAEQAVDLERNKLKEEGGWQDQYICSIGGFRNFTFQENTVNFSEKLIDDEIARELSTSLLLIPVGPRRLSAAFAAKTARSARNPAGFEMLKEMAKIADEVVLGIQGSDSADEVISLLAEGVNLSWALKRKLAREISNNDIDEAIAYAVSVGGLAAKLCGAGGSGYLLVITPKGQAHVMNHKFFNGRGVNLNITDAGVFAWDLR